MNEQFDGVIKSTYISCFEFQFEMSLSRARASAFWGVCWKVSLPSWSAGSSSGLPRQNSLLERASEVGLNEIRTTSGIAQNSL